MKRFLISLLVLFVLGLPQIGQAQNADKVFQARMRAADETTLLAGNTQVGLWGLEAVSDVTAVQKLKARMALENAIGARPVECEWKTRVGNRYFAQCVSDNSIDLGLFMIQQGYAIVDRSMIYNTVFEVPYLQAETAAQDAGLGVWREGSTGGYGSGGSGDSSWLVFIMLTFFFALVGAFGFIALQIMRGFKQIIAAQNRNLDMLSKQRKLKDKERGIVAVMLEAEIKSNRAKIQAYLVVYEEMIANLRNVEAEPKYKKVGDIVQKQPALDRQVFDRNTDKIDMLGRDLSSALIHFYARIKSKPEYENIEPETSRADAIALVEKAIDNAQRLNVIAGQLLDDFSNRAYGDALEES